MDSSEKPSLSHVDSAGNVRMVDVSAKQSTQRVATASVEVHMQPEVLKQLLAGTLRKGEALTAAKIAGISAAKRTGELIPLCHTLPLDCVDIDLAPIDDRRLKITATTRTRAPTGVEMEAMTAAAIAALTLYDMAKAGDKSIVIGPLQLERKSGGRSGDYQRTK